MRICDRCGHVEANDCRIYAVKSVDASCEEEEYQLSACGCDVCRRCMEFLAIRVDEFMRERAVQKGLK